jgi:hypothetical protein
LLPAGANKKKDLLMALPNDMPATSQGKMASRDSILASEDSLTPMRSVLDNVPHGDILGHAMAICGQSCGFQYGATTGDGHAKTRHSEAASKKQLSHAKTSAGGRILTACHAEERNVFEASFETVLTHAAASLAQEVQKSGQGRQRHATSRLLALFRTL